MQVRVQELEHILSVQAWLPATFRGATYRSRRKRFERQHCVYDNAFGVRHLNTLARGGFSSPARGPVTAVVAVVLVAIANDL
jgi:hypothetical protein